MAENSERNMQEIEQAKKELEALKTEVEGSIETLKKTCKDSAVTLVVRSIVAACAANVMDKVADVFLPKNLKGIAKAGVAFGTFFIPEIAANIAADKVDKILRED